jgi:hypothetical protein
MITAIQLIFSPFETWEKIALKQRGFLWVLGVYLVPALVICLGIEAYLLIQLGEKEGVLGDVVVKVPLALAIRYAGFYAALLLASVVVGAKFLALASESFNVHTTYLQCFTVMAYGFGPLILVRIFDGLPQINTWVCWALGAATATSVLYHGVGMILKPDQTKGFGLYLMSIIILVLMSGMTHFAAVEVLHGKILRPRAVQASSVRTRSLADGITAAWGEIGGA